MIVDSFCIAELPKREEKVAWCRLPKDADARMSHLRRGWYWGRQEFAEWAQEFADALVRKGKSRVYLRSRERQARGAMQAAKLLKEGLLVAGLDKASLIGLPANEPCKVELARLLWKNTTVSQAWIANISECGALRMSVLHYIGPNRSREAKH